MFTYTKTFYLGQNHTPHKLSLTVSIFHKEMWSCIFVIVALSISVVFPANAGYIVCESDGGLSNRLRTMISHMFMGKVLHNGAQLVMVWDINDACPGHFLQIFKPLEGVTFITNSSREMFDKQAIKVYPNSRDGFERTLLNFDVNLVVKKRFWWDIELSYWERLLWVREVDERVEDYVRLHSVCNITAMHIRKTDMDLALPHHRRSAYTQYYRWVDARPVNESVYLMTDNPSTQRHFQEKYGLEKIKVYTNISSPFPETNSSVGEDFSAQLAAVKLPVDHRFTTLEHAAVDVLIAAHARDFRRAPFSSVSDFVRMMNFLHRWKWCGCPHRGC